MAQTKQINPRNLHGVHRLPKNWRAVESSAGELLYLERICGGYIVQAAPDVNERSQHAGYVAHPSGAWELIDVGPTRDHALLICREHLHANGSKVTT